MVKKIISVAGAAALLAAFPAAALAQTSSGLNDIDILPIPYPRPVPFEVTPGNPLHLQGCGGLKAEGKGFFQFQNVNGYIYLSGKGTLAIEDSDLSKVVVTGFDQKVQIGHWIVYIGQGEAKASGIDLDLTFHGKGTVSARGCGEVTFKGTWKGTYWRLIRVWTIPIPEPLELESLTAEIN